MATKKDQMNKKKRSKLIRLFQINYLLWTSEAMTEPPSLGELDKEKAK